MEKEEEIRRNVPIEEEERERIREEIRQQYSDSCSSKNPFCMLHGSEIATPRDSYLKKPNTHTLGLSWPTITKTATRTKVVT